MPNDTDTDVLDSTSADSVLAGGGADKSSDVLAGGGADPGADVSMQDVSGAASQTTGMASPLGGQQPGQLPPMIGQPPAGGVGPGAQQAPVGAGIHARHGGLLTGLAGVLLDGIAAGIMTPQSGQGFSQAAQRAYQMPMERQQQAMQMQQFQTQQELDKAKISMAHVQDLQARALATKLTDEQIAGYTDEEVKTHEQLEEQGAVDQIAKVPTREQASQHLNQIAIQDPANRQNYWMWPTGHDGQGNITGWGIYKMNPDKPIGPGHALYLPSKDPTTGEESFKRVPLDSKMPVWQFNVLKTDSVMQRMMQDASKAMTPLQQAQVAKYGANPVLARDPSGRQRQMSTEEAERKGMMAGAINLGSAQVQKNEDVVTQMAAVQDAVTTYREWMNQVYREGGMTPTQRTAIDSLMPRSLNIDVAQLGPYSAAIKVPELLSRPIQAAALQSLTRSQREAVNAYWGMLNAVPTAQRAMINQGRTNTEVMEIEMRTVPDMLRDAENFNIAFNDYQRRLGIVDRKNPLIEGYDTVDQQRTKTEDYVRDQIKAAGRGELAPGTPLRGGGTAGQQAPMTGKQKSTGKPVVSYDGGKTWQLAQP